VSKTRGHLVTADQARQKFQLDHVVFMPTGNPPHKEKLKMTDAEHRYLMTLLAVVDNPYFSVSRMEIDSKETTFTIDTVRHFTEIYSSKITLYFITGADAILDITTWKDYKILLKTCEFIAASRPGYSFRRLESILGNAFPEVMEHIHLMEIPAMAISSTLLRNRVAAGETIRYLTPQAVEQYINKNRLYLRLLA